MRISSRPLRIVLAAGLLLASLLAGAHAADLQKLKSPQWTERSAAFYTLAGDLVGNREAARRLDADQRKALIDLLAFEDSWATGRAGLDEDHASYFADLVDVVTSQADARALPVLLRPGIVATGDMVIEGLARIGDPAAEAVLARLPGATQETGKVALTLALARMLERKTLAPRAKDKVQRTLAGLGVDEDEYVRASAARGLGHADKTVGLPVLESLAARGTHGTGAKAAALARGPNELVREEAAEALQRLRSVQE